MKKILFLIAIATMFVACGTKTSTEASEANDTTAVAVDTTVVSDSTVVADTTAVAE